MDPNWNRRDVIAGMIVFKLVWCAGIGFGCWWLWENVHPALALGVLAYMTWDPPRD